MTIFFEIAVALVLASVAGIIFHALKQPPIIGFIFAGLIIAYLGGIRDHEHLELIEALSSIGVALLLFLVGLEMNLREIKNVGLPFFVLGFAGALFTLSAGLLVATLLGFPIIVAFYLAAAFGLSSSVIIIRIFSEKKELKSMHGRIAVGLLIFQHFFAMLILIFLASLEIERGFAINIFVTLFKGGLLIILAVALAKIFPKFLAFIGGAPDLLYLFGISWAVGLGALFASPWVGLSVEVGGFLAGIALANSSEHFQIAARLKPLRDFFLIVLFMGLGVRVLLGAAIPIFPAVILGLFAVFGCPTILFFIMVLLKYRARTAFLVSLTTIPLSEFGFVMMLLGEHLGHIDASHVSLVALLSVISIFISSYALAYGNQIYRFFRPALKIFESKNRLVEERGEETYLENHIILVGIHRMGFNILKALTNSGEDFVAVDFDPQVIAYLRESRLPALYGDIADPEIQELVALGKARIIISTIPDFSDNAAILGYIMKNNPTCKVIVRAESEHEAEELYDMSADYVLLPHFVGGLEIAEMIMKDRALSGLDELRARDFKLIRGEEA